MRSFTPQVGMSYWLKYGRLGPPQQVQVLSISDSTGVVLVKVGTITDPMTFPPWALFETEKQALQDYLQYETQRLRSIRELIQREQERKREITETCSALRKAIAKLGEVNE